MPKYNTETFNIPPGIARPVSKRTDNDYYVYNVGRVKLTVQILRGLQYGRYNSKCEENYPLESVEVQPGQEYKIHVRNPDPPMCVFVRNNDKDLHGFIHTYGMREGYNDIDNGIPEVFNPYENPAFYKAVAVYGAGTIPVIGAELSTLIGYFWPDKESDAWNDVKDQVGAMVDTRAQEVIKALSHRELAYMKHRIDTSSREINDPSVKDTAPHFMNIVEDLVGFEKKLQFTDESDRAHVRINYALLPLYATFINFKLLFYQFGIMNQRKVNLTDEHVRRLKTYIKEVVTDPTYGAIDFVDRVYREKFIDQYNALYPETIFDELALVRGYCAVNGFQHLHNWKYIANNPTDPKRPEHNPVVVFDTHFGRADAKQSRVMVVEEIDQPYKPKLINGKLNKMVKIEVFLTSYKTIGGLKVTYANGDVATTGPKTSGDSEVIDLKNKLILSMHADGEGQITQLTFKLNDESSRTIGTASNTARHFLLPKHHIVGFLMTGSSKLAYEQAANLAVSFQLLDRQNITGNIANLRKANEGPASEV